MIKSTKAKGYRTVRRTREYLENEGYITDTVEKTGKFVKVKDLFGLWDLCCVHPKKGVLFVQCKTNRPATKKPLQDFSDKYNVCGACFTWYDRKGFVVQMYSPSASIERVDLRKKG